MKKFLATLLVVALCGLVGCQDKGTSGGPGAKEKDKESKLKQGDESSSLSVPGTTKLKQGETQEAVIGIKRGKNFEEDVVLVFDDLPQGVTVEPASPTIKKGDENAKVMVKAKEDAALGDHTIKVKAKPTKGKEATNEVKVSVSKK